MSHVRISFRNLRCGVMLCSVFLWSSCASYTDETKEVVASYRAGSYEQSLQKLESSGIKEQNRNRLLYLLERAMILDRLGQGEESRALLIKADKVVDQLFTTSISKEAATYIYNEGAQDYPGEDYEKVGIHTMLAHSFVAEGNLAAARVEAARINTRLNEINSSYGDNKNKYKEDAYARYLAGIIYEALGEDDSAIVDYRSALKIYESDYRNFFEVGVPDQLVEALRRLLIKRRREDEARTLLSKYRLNAAEHEPKGEYGEIIVLHEQGQIARKEAAEFILPIGKQIVRFSFPVIKVRKNYFGRTGFELGAGHSELAEVTQNMNTIAGATLEDRRLRMVAKSAARLIIKGQLTQKAEKDFGLLGLIAGNVYGAVTETADTRSWSLLPASFSVSRMRVKAGTYDLTIYNNGRVSQRRSAKVKAGEIVLLRDG